MFRKCIDLVIMLTHFKEIIIEQYKLHHLRRTSPNVVEAELETERPSHRLRPLKKVEILFELVISMSWSRIIRSIKGLLESPAFTLLHRMLSSFVATPLKSYLHFSDLGVEIALGHRHVKKC